MRSRIRKWILVGGGVALLLGLLLVKGPLFYFSSGGDFLMKKREEKTGKQKREPWITIFVHGSFGSLLSVLNAYRVLNDDVEGTSYKKLVGMMRKDSFFFREQPLLGKGLIKVRPSFDLCSTGSKKYAAYPLFKVYDEVTEYVSPGRERNFFYTFGWSGLLSQKRRGIEAIRFYNMVDEELAFYRRQGIVPKVRVITHSHGGNVIAYISAINDALNTIQVETNRRKEAILSIRERLDSLPNKKEAKRKKGQKRWDYTPERTYLAVDELVLWGMPVQPETDHLFTGSTFKNTYHFYSDEDLVQRIDFISTKKEYSDRRFDPSRIKDSSSLVQSRIVIDRKAASGRPKEKKDKKQESFWSVLFSGGSFVNPTSKDPTHKELWFFSWKEPAAEVREFALAPFPVAIFSPLFVKLINQKPELTDVDITITKSGDAIEFCLVKHDDTCSQAECSIENKFLTAMKEKVLPWRPKTVSSQDVFKLLRRYTDYL